LSSTVGDIHFSEQHIGIFIIYMIGARY